MALGGTDVAAAVARRSRRVTAATTGTHPVSSDVTTTGDGIAAPHRPFLHRLNPIAKLAAPLPVMIALLFTRDVATPLVFTVGALALLLVGARLSRRAIAGLLIGTPVGVALIGFTLGVWVDPARIDPAAAGASVVLIEIGDWRFTLAAYLVGMATALRIAAILLLSLLVGLTTTGPELVRASVQNLRMPYRVGFTALAALRFVPRFRHELDVIRAAHRVRGMHRGRGPVAALRRIVSYAIPLLASAIRHAERVALAMDARAFGAHPTRTERVISRWRARDTAFVVLFWAASVAVFWVVATA
jgi:energy-coupling factor transport system permease protein